MSSPPKSAPRLGGTQLRERWRGRHRTLAAVIVALVIAATVAHHVTPEHSAMPGMGGGHTDHALISSAACLGIVESAFVLLVAGAIFRVARIHMRRRRPAPARLSPVAVQPPHPPPRFGPPQFLRLLVLRY